MISKKYSISHLSDDFDEVLIYDKGFYSVRKGYKWGLINSIGELVLQCIYDWIWNIHDEKVTFRYKGKGLYIPLKLLPSKYDIIYGFHHSFSIVKLCDKYGVITEDGKEVFPCLYENLTYSKDRLFREYIDSSTNKYFNKGKWIIIDKWTLEIKPERYSQIITLPNGFKKVTDSNGRWGMLDVYNRELIPCLYDGLECKEFMTILGKSGFFNKVYFEAKLSNKILIISLDNKIFPHYGYDFNSYNQLMRAVEDPNENFFDKCDIVEYNEYVDDCSGGGLFPKCIHEKWGFVNENNELIIPAKFDAVGCYSDGLFAAKIKDKWGFINKKVQTVIPFKYNNVDRFSEGLVAVRMGKKWGYIDNKGKVIINFQYDSASGFCFGLAKVSRRSSNDTITKDGIVIKSECTRFFPEREDWRADTWDALTDGQYGDYPEDGFNTSDLLDFI